MKRDILYGLLTTFFSILIVFGGISLSIAQEEPISVFPTLIFPANTLLKPMDVGNPTNTGGGDKGEMQTVTPPPGPSTVASPTEIIPTNCAPPLGWVPYPVPGGASLDEIARQNGITANQLMAANCLVSKELMPDVILYLPPFTPTVIFSQTIQPALDTRLPEGKVVQVTPVPCGKPHGWVIYFVQSGDTLESLSKTFQITIADLLQANCLENSTGLNTGQRLYRPLSPTPDSTGNSNQAESPSATPTVLSAPTETTRRLNPEAKNSLLSFGVLI